MAEELVVGVVAAVSAAELGEVGDELDAVDPFDVFEPGGSRWPWTPPAPPLCDAGPAWTQKCWVTDRGQGIGVTVLGRAG